MMSAPNLFIVGLASKQLVDRRKHMPYGIGLIGNRAHQNTYGPILHDRPDCRIVAAAEHSAEKGAPLERAYGVECLRDYNAVMEDPADRKSTRLNSSHSQQSRMPSSA